MKIKSKLSQGCTMPLLFLLLSHFSFSQVQDSSMAKPQSFFSGNIVAKIECLTVQVSALEAENKAQQAELERLMSAVLQESFSTTVFQTVQEV
ncbi:hypothetical protein GOQ04_07520 [Emticicia sp. ODNR4P]|nr:hypothetical protein [Emticicia sp. ODNR4P]